MVMEEEQALDGHEDRAAVMSRRLAEGREHLEGMEVKSMGDFHKNQRDLQKQRDLLLWMEEQQVSWHRERESMEIELRKLRSEVAHLKAFDIDRGSEEIDLKALAEYKWNGSRQALAPITPEAVRARTPSMKQGVRGVGKENYQKSEEVAEENYRLRREKDHWKEKANRASRLYKGLQSQYNFLLGLKDVGHLNLTTNHDDLQAALEAGFEKPSKIRKRSPGETLTQGRAARSCSPNPSDMNAPSTPVPDSGKVPPQAVAEVVTGPTASTSDLQLKVKAEPAEVVSGSTASTSDPQVKVKAEPVHSESSKAIAHVPLTKNEIAGGLDTELEGKLKQTDNSGTPAAMVGSRKRSLEPSGKQSAKPPAFKFVEPVRKKGERENLQGTECKLCKKFYDAVVTGNAQGLVESRCNHLEKSRHRFRDLPPETPEGFWNIGFDSDF